jgi:hypothetical protein
MQERGIAMKKRVLLVALILAVGATQQSWAQECEACYRENPSDPWICIYQNFGYIDCIGGAQCTKGASCDIAVGCFLAGTLVTVHDGTVPIENLEVGDYILGVSEEGMLTYHRVTAIHRGIQTDFYVVNGSLCVTAQHPFFVNDTWVTAENLWIGAELQNADGGVVTVQRMQAVEKGVRVYNLEVDGSHTFFADGVLVHNKKPIPSG